MGNLVRFSKGFQENAVSVVVLGMGYGGGMLA